jgi:hypothetical protein
MGFCILCVFLHLKHVFTSAAENGEDDADNDSDNDNNSHTDQTTPHPRWIPKQKKDSKILILCPNP